MPALPRQRDALRTTALVLVALALLTPRLAPAFAWAIDGHRSVLLCTGTGLVRMTVDKRGDTVDIVSEAARHCDLVGTPRSEVERRWQAMGEPRAAAPVLAMPADPARTLPQRTPSAHAARGPPAPG